MSGGAVRVNTQFACFTGTKVQILTRLPVIVSCRVDAVLVSDAAALTETSSAAALTKPVVLLAFEWGCCTN